MAQRPFRQTKSQICLVGIGLINRVKMFMFVLGAAHTIESMKLRKCVVKIKTQANNSMDVEVTTATLLKTSFVKLYVVCGGFAPRHLSR